MLRKICQGGLEVSENAKASKLSTLCLLNTGRPIICCDSQASGHGRESSTVIGSVGENLNTRLPRLLKGASVSWIFYIIYNDRDIPIDF